MSDGTLVSAPAPVAPAPVAPAPVSAPAPATPVPEAQAPFVGGQDLPDGLAARAKSAAIGDDPTRIAPVPAAKPEPAKPDQAAPATSVQEMVGAELMADPLVATSVSLIEHLCGDKVDLARAFGKAEEEADARFIDANYLKEVLGEAGASAVVKAATQVLEHAQGYGQRQAQAVWDHVGGKEQLDKAAEFFQKNADPQRRTALQRLLDSGDTDSMKFAAKEIVDFAAAQGAIVIHNALPLGAPAAEKGMTHDEYINELDKGRRFGFKPGQYEALRAKRALGRQQGI